MSNITEIEQLRIKAKELQKAMREFSDAFENTYLDTENSEERDLYHQGTDVVNHLRLIKLWWFTND